MKSTAYALKKKLGDSWGLTLLVSSIVIAIVSNILSAGVYAVADIADDAAGGLGIPSMVLSVVAMLFTLLGMASYIGMVAGAVLLIVERVDLSEKARVMRTQAQSQQSSALTVHGAGSPSPVEADSTPGDTEKKTVRGFLSTNIGLSLIAISVITSILSSVLLVGTTLLAATVNTSFEYDSGALVALILVLIIGATVLMISGLVFPVGVVVFIVEEVRKRNRLQAEMASYASDQYIVASDQHIAPEHAKDTDV